MLFSFLFKDSKFHSLKWRVILEIIRSSIFKLFFYLKSRSFTKKTKNKNKNKNVLIMFRPKLKFALVVLYESRK